MPCHLACHLYPETSWTRWREFEVRHIFVQYICVCFHFFPKAICRSRWPFAVSGCMSHAPSPRSGKRNKQLVEVKKKHTSPWEARSLSQNPLLLLPHISLPVSSFLPFFPSIYFLMPCTSQQATAICMTRSFYAFLQLFWRECVCVCVHICMCLSLSVFAGVNVCRLEASQLKLQWKGRGECSKPIFISQSNQRHAADTAHGRETTLHWHASLIVYVVWVPQCCWSAARCLLSWIQAK